MANATVDAAYLSSLNSNPNTMRADAAYAVVVQGNAGTTQIHAGYLAVMIPVNPPRRRPVVFFPQ
jgi:hypothetical protein